MTPFLQIQTRENTAPVLKTISAVHVPLLKLYKIRMPLFLHLYIHDLSEERNSLKQVHDCGYATGT